MKDGTTTTLPRLSLGNSVSADHYNEDYVRNLAFDNPACLPIAEIDSAYRDAVPVCKELNTPAGPLDALFVTPEGRLVVLEAKLWRNPEARRKVVAQPRSEDDRRACWVLWESETRTVRLRKTEFDRLAAARDIIREGLPLEFTTRLLNDKELKAITQPS